MTSEWSRQQSPKRGGETSKLKEKGKSSASNAWGAGQDENTGLSSNNDANRNG